MHNNQLKEARLSIRMELYQNVYTASVKNGSQFPGEKAKAAVENFDKEFPKENTSLETELTKDEYRLFHMLITGHSTKEIAYEFGLKPRSIERRKQQLRNKYSVQTNTQLVAKLLLSDHFTTFISEAKEFLNGDIKSLANDAYYCDAPDASGLCTHFKDGYCQSQGDCNRKHPNS